MPTYTSTEDSSDGQIENVDWDPDPCELREEALADRSGHAARNIAMLRDGARDGAISREAAAESIARIRDRDRRLKGAADDTEGD